MFAIEAVGLKKSYETVQAVAGIDIVVPEGEVTALLGPNGAGKTTTLMMIVGVTDPDEGTVKLMGHPLPRERSRALANCNFFASYAGLPIRMRVSEIFEVFAGIYGVGRSRIAEVAEMFGIGPLLSRYSNQLSSGQRTLVGLAKAMLNRPRLLILDEPTASLDPHVATEVREVLAGIHQNEEFTLFVTSHNMADIQRLCRRVIFMKHGRVVADGTAAEIQKRFGAADLEETFISIATGVYE